MGRLAARFLAAAIWLHVVAIADGTFDELYENVIPADTAECLDKVCYNMQGIREDRDNEGRNTDTLAIA